MWEAEVKKHAGDRPGHAPDAGELVGAPRSTRNMWMRVFNVGLTTKVCSRQWPEPVGRTALENTACELVSQVNRAQRTGRLFSRQTVVF